MSGGAADGTRRVRVTTHGGVTEVRLSRPDKRNALDPAMFAALVRTGERLRTEGAVRAVVLSGEGPDFCAGLDLGALRAMAEVSGSRPPQRYRLRTARPGRRVSAPRTCGPGSRYR
ncbi:enoyl-CoA hydratase-related protein [Pseudonocardia sp. NPDC049635]|uniref:enoyl-CoA hydratase-related protein n=1 Tax=Pseudonocardia sp. NPDC049635 TaxID=3155506 RepID=UPI0033F4D2B0